MTECFVVYFTYNIPLQSWRWWPCPGYTGNESYTSLQRSQPEIQSTNVCHLSHLIYEHICNCSIPSFKCWLHVTKRSSFIEQKLIHCKIILSIYLFSTCKQVNHQNYFILKIWTVLTTIYTDEWKVEPNNQLRRNTDIQNSFWNLSKDYLGVKYLIVLQRKINVSFLLCEMTFSPQ